jgi:hypothetical protein
MRAHVSQNTSNGNRTRAACSPTWKASMITTSPSTSFRSAYVKRVEDLPRAVCYICSWKSSLNIRRYILKGETTQRETIQLGYNNNTSTLPQRHYTPPYVYIKQLNIQRKGKSQAVRIVFVTMMPSEWPSDINDSLPTLELLTDDVPTPRC